MGAEVKIYLSFFPVMVVVAVVHTYFVIRVIQPDWCHWWYHQAHHPLVTGRWDGYLNRSLSFILRINLEVFELSTPPPATRQKTALHIVSLPIHTAWRRRMKTLNMQSNAIQEL